MIRIAALLLVAPAFALAQVSPSPLPKPDLTLPSLGQQAPLTSPPPSQSLTGPGFGVGPDFQAMLLSGAESGELRVRIRDRRTGEVDEISIYQLLSIPPEVLEEELEAELVDPESGAVTPLPAPELEAFVREHPEYGHSASIEPGGGGWMPVRRAFFDPVSTPPEAAYHVILVVGRGLEGDPRLDSAGAALCGQPEFSEEENLDPSRLAVVAAPVARRIEEGDKVRLGEDYDFERAARWLDTLTGTRLGRETSATLDRDAFGFIAAEADPTRGLDTASPEAVDAADAIYIDLSAISPGYVEEVVSRIVRGMHEGDAISHTGAIAVLEAFSLVERIGAATLQIAGLLEPGAASAAPSGEGC